MKRNTVSVVILVFTGLMALVMTSCVKTGTAPPVITLIGDTTVFVSLNSTWADPGVNVIDDKDGTDAVSSDFSSTNPNTNIAGTYIIHYYTIDNNGSAAQISRKVKVVNDAHNLAGMYRESQTVTNKNAGSYTDTVLVTASETVNDELLVSNFGGLGGDVTVSIKVSNTVVNISPSGQAPPGMNDPGTITGSGTVSGNKIINFNYVVSYSSGGNDHSASSWTKLTPPF